MRLFISYARVDKYYCLQIVDMLDVHEVWFDNRLHAGQQWWSQIRRMLEWCDGFVYLLSPDSVTSKYCQKEFEIARSLDKHIFPVLIQARTPIPASLEHIQYVNFSEGITADAVKLILNSIYVVERQNDQAAAPTNGKEPVRSESGELMSATDLDSLITDAAAALENAEYDRAVFLLKQARDSGYTSQYIDLGEMLHQAEAALDNQAYIQDAEREYTPIASLVQHERTRKLGCQAFRAFHNNFPDYDPGNLASICLPHHTALLEWCAVPADMVKIKQDSKIKIYRVDAFEIGTYPVTNAQYVEFIDAADGYANQAWWNYSAWALRWRQAHPDAMYPKPIGHDHPCVNVCWYEAVAFCRWLSHRTGMRIALPTEQQWLRAAQGDDNRLYPWGNQFDPSCCNTKERNMRLTVPVTGHPNGASAYGVLGMAGNVWEWCVNNAHGGDDAHGDADENRVIKGGSFKGAHGQAQCRFSHALNPHCHYDSVGFRLVHLRD